MTSIQLKDLGLVNYANAIDIQLTHFKYIKDLKIANRSKVSKVLTPNFFFFVEHPHVYTMGKNGNIANILLNPKQLKERGVDYFQTNRGGDSTYHGPGQIVGYPIIDLDNFFSDIHGYMRKLEEVIILSIATFGLVGQRSEGETGVWLDVGTQNARKICAMGVHTSSWVTMHGFALNVNTDLSYFDGIIPCGITNKGITSLANELGKEVDEQLVKETITKHFSEVFKTKFISYKGIDG